MEEPLERLAKAVGGPVAAGIKDQGSRLESQGVLEDDLDEQPGRLGGLDAVVLGPGDRGIGRDAEVRVAPDDVGKVHRSREHVWGTCTFHEYTARCPNRATTVRADNWVALGLLFKYEDRPAWNLPVSGRLYFRKLQLPERPKAPGSHEPFRTK